MRYWNTNELGRKDNARAYCFHRRSIKIQADLVASPAVLIVTLNDRLEARDAACILGFFWGLDFNHVWQISQHHAAQHTQCGVSFFSVRADVGC